MKTNKLWFSAGYCKPIFHLLDTIFNKFLPTESNIQTEKQFATIRSTNGLRGHTRHSTMATEDNFKETMGKIKI